MTSPRERLVMLPNLARAAGGAGDRQTFDDAWAEWWSLSSEWQSTPAERLVALANLARAAGGAGDRQAFDDAWAEVWSLSSEWHATPDAGPALLDLARGAASLKDWARAERAASAARDVAMRLELGKVLLEAEAVLDSVTRRKALEEAAEPAGGDEQAETDAMLADLLRSLA